MPYSIFKLDIIMSRWDQRIYLLTHGMSLNRKLLWGKGGNVSVFIHRILQKHASFQNDSCNRLTCEFMSTLAVMTRKLCWAHRERGIRESSHLQTRWSNFLSSPWAKARKAELLSIWGQLMKNRKLLASCENMNFLPRSPPPPI